MNSSDPESINKNNAKNASERSHLRKKIRQQRRSFSAEHQEQAASKLLGHILLEESFKAASKIAFYHAFDCEIDPAPAIQTAIRHGKRCFLPVINPDNESLVFIEYTKGSSLEKIILAYWNPFNTQIML